MEVIPFEGNDSLVLAMHLDEGSPVVAGFGTTRYAGSLSVPQGSSVCASSFSSWGRAARLYSTSSWRNCAAAGMFSPPHFEPF